MTNITALEAERDAYRHWLGFMMTHVATGVVCTPPLLKGHLADLEATGDPNLATLQLVAVDIIERFYAYVESNNPDDLWLRG